jgi:hypothetical protein
MYAMYICVLQLLASLQRFRDLGKLHRVALEVVARSLEQGQIDSLKVTVMHFTIHVTAQRLMTDILLTYCSVVSSMFHRCCGVCPNHCHQCRRHTGAMYACSCSTSTAQAHTRDQSSFQCYISLYSAVCVYVTHCLYHHCVLVCAVYCCA